MSLNILFIRLVFKRYKFVKAMKKTNLIIGLFFFIFAVQSQITASSNYKVRNTTTDTIIREVNDETDNEPDQFLPSIETITFRNVNLQNTDSDDYFIGFQAGFQDGVERLNLPGMPKVDYYQAFAIRWIPIFSSLMKWIEVDVNLNRYTTYAEFDSIINILAASEMVRAYKASLFSADGRPMYCMEIGQGNAITVFTAGVHAREVANPQFLLKYARRLIDLYEKGDSATVRLLKENKIVILPCVNPDGYEMAILGVKALRDSSLFFMKMTDREAYCSKSNAKGVDLNRNFPSYTAGVLWKNKKQERLQSLSPSGLYYAGAYLGSENETKVAMNFLMKYIPLSKRYIDVHSAGRVVYAGKPHLSEEFNLLCYETGTQIKMITGYELFGLSKEPTGEGTDGTITDFASEIAAGFIYNQKLERMAPKDCDTLKFNYETLAWQCSVNTIETLFMKKVGGGLLERSTIGMQVEEWDKFHLFLLFNTLAGKYFQEELVCKPLH